MTDNPPVMLTFYTNRGEGFYHVGPFDSDEDAVAYANRAHKEIGGGVSNVTISCLNRPNTTPNYVMGGGDIYFDNAALHEAYHLEPAT